MTPKEVLKTIKDKGIVMVDLKFIDLLGQWQHFTVPISEFSDSARAAARVPRVVPMLLKFSTTSCSNIPAGPKVRM